MHPSPDVLALLALGEQAGTPDEQAHVESCPQCRTEIADLARAVAAGRGVQSGDDALVTPPDRVWDAIRTELGFASATDEAQARGTPERSEVSPVTALPRPARPESNGAGPDTADTDEVEPVAARAERPSPSAGSTAGVTDIADARRRSSRGRRGLALLVAAAVALVLGLGLGLGLDRILGPRQTTLWTAQLQALPQFPGSSGEAMVQEDGNGHRTLFIELNSPEPVDGSREVWLIDSDVTRTRSLGYLLGDSGRFNIPADLDPKQFPVVDVSKEPPADADTRHSGTSIVRGTLNV
jgi:Anti-sigma-K factor rskA